jgi:hypothetical protein
MERMALRGGQRREGGLYSAEDGILCGRPHRVVITDTWTRSHVSVTGSDCRGSEVVDRGFGAASFTRCGATGPWPMGSQTQQLRTAHSPSFP